MGDYYMIARRSGNAQVIILDVQEKADTLEEAAEKLQRFPGCRVFLGTEDVTPTGITFKAAPAVAAPAVVKAAPEPLPPVGSGKTMSIPGAIAQGSGPASTAVGCTCKRGPGRPPKMCRVCGLPVLPKS